MKQTNRLVAALALTAVLAGTAFSGAAMAAGPDGFGGPGGPGGFGGPGAAVEETTPVYQGPKLTVEGEIYGSACTNGSSCVVANADHSDIQYEKGVTLVLSQDGLDDSKIDSSRAKVELMSGDGYTVNELKFAATSLNGTWENGRLNYSLASTDLIWNNDGYAITADSGCGREWSCFGGDGSGNYYFRLQVSGILYDGQEVETQIIPVHVYIYGRSATDLAKMNFGTLTPSWSWEGTGEKPILCDDLADTFVAHWPAGVNGSGVKTEDVEITLSSQYGDTLVLTAGKDYTVTSSSVGETDVQVTYENWAFTPVYNTMTITVKPDHLVYDMANYKLGSLSYTTDIASVYAYSVQSGGAMPVDHAVCYTYYGVNLTSWQQVQLPTIYRLKLTDEDGNVKYYATKGGLGYLTDDVNEAKTWDATGPDEMNYQLVDGHMVYVTLLGERTEEKWVGLKKYTFTKEYDSAFPGNAFDFYGSIDPNETEVTYTLQPGYAMPETWLQHSMWAWKPDIGTGWTE